MVAADQELDIREQWYSGNWGNDVKDTISMLEY